LKNDSVFNNLLWVFAQSDGLNKRWAVLVRRS
jgi:hypothetical protein